MDSRFKTRCFAIFSAAAFLLLAAASCWAQAAQQAVQRIPSLTVERIYGKPSLSGELTRGLQWSPDGKLLSYIQSSGSGNEAQEELWVIDVSNGRRRVLVSADKLAKLLPARKGAGSQRTGLGRVSARQYQWAPNAGALLFVSQGELYWYDLKTQSGKRLVAPPKDAAQKRTGAHLLAYDRPALADAKISPDGRWVSFVRDYDLWVVSVATGRAHALTHGGREELMNGQLDWVYPEELGIRTAYWWSPDSQKIAYLQMDERPVTQYPLVNFLTYTGDYQLERYPKAGDANPVVRVGVVGVGASAAAPPAPRWMEIGNEKDIYIPRVDWLRDSRRLAIQRLNRAQNKLELLFANAATGQSHVVLTEQDPYWVNLSDDLYFFSDGRRFLWSSERDTPETGGYPNPGLYRHLYLYDLSGRLQAQLTHGDWEVTSVEGVDEKHSFVYFTGTKKSPIERQLYRVAIGGTHEITQLTRQDGWHSVVMAPDEAHFYDTYSNALRTAQQGFYQADGSHPQPINENPMTALDSYALQRPEFFTVPGADGTPLHAMMTKPQGFDPVHKYPVIVYLYGGPHSQVVRDAWDSTRFLWHQMMAQKGFLIFSVDNRGMAGRGHGFESAIYHHFGKTELDDQLAAVEYLKKEPYVDPNRIGVWGWSFGGFMTCTAMLRAPGVFKAGFAGAPVTDWRQYDTIYTERYMGRPQDNAEGYKTSSPVNYAAELRGKLLIAHATGDDNVHFGNTMELVEQLTRNGHSAGLMVFPGRGHGISDPPARIQIFKRVTDFFLKNLCGPGSVEHSRCLAE